MIVPNFFRGTQRGTLRSQYPVDSVLTVLSVLVYIYVSDILYLLFLKHSPDGSRLLKISRLTHIYPNSLGHLGHLGQLACPCGLRPSDSWDSQKNLGQSGTWQPDIYYDNGTIAAPTHEWRPSRNIYLYSNQAVRPEIDCLTQIFPI